MAMLLQQQLTHAIMLLLCMLTLQLHRKCRKFWR
jgi:hypothetical protein